MFLGDTSFGENYQERLAAAGGENVLKSRGYDSMMANFSTILDDVALIVANLETPVTDLRSSPLSGLKRYIHYADVQQTPYYLAKYGIDLVSLGNNHAMDMGATGLSQTVASLARQGIATCGAGEDGAQARLPHRRAVNLSPSMVTLVLFCAFEFSETYDRDFDFYAGEGAPGVNPLDGHEVAAQVRALRQDNSRVFAVAFPHWGRNYHPITANQRRLGRALVDAGVDLVIGHGAHLLQGLELYRGRWIVYGIGNFVFGSTGRYASFGAHPYSAIAELAFEVAGDASVAATLRLYPIVTDNLLTDYRGRFVTSEEYQLVGKLLAAQSHVVNGFDNVVERGRNQHGWYYEVDLVH
jgi:poly-gamma-glutamate capsule biosynthesis protein CapA/YwtB (metallophosphatase superfamily)